MKNTLSKIIIFAVGAAVGSAVTWKMLDTKYKHIAEEEIESMEEYYKDKYGVNTDEDILEEEVEENSTIKNDIQAYAAIAKSMNYADESEIEEGFNMDDKPYQIKPDEYGEYQDYEMVNLVYYADDVLADEMDTIIDNVDEIVGADFADGYGVYDDDTVFIRNDKLMCDYEIQRDSRTYDEVMDEYSTDMEP